MLSMPTPIYVVDAFTSEPFHGNPAGVCPLDAQPPDEWMQNVAAEMNHAETAFFWPEADHYRLRWFTPTTEVDLCGHATLATAHILFGKNPELTRIDFATRSGILTATNRHESIELDFPAAVPHAIEMPEGIAEALGAAPLSVSENVQAIIAEFANERDVRALNPDFAQLKNFGNVGVIATAPSDSPDRDFVCRFFAPQAGIPEDPVTGSAYCGLAPYWTDKLGKTTMKAFQCSTRGGSLEVEFQGDRVLLRGEAVTVLAGRLTC